MKIGEPTKETIEEMILKTLDLLFLPGDVVELRMLHTKKGTISGYFNDFKTLSTRAQQFSGKVPAIYVTLNPVNKDLLARASNRIEYYSKTTTSDNDISSRRWILMDVDPIRSKGISSTDEEHKLALNKAIEISAVFKGLGWPEPIYADSGNGGHLLWRIDLSNDESSRELIKRFLGAADYLFSDERNTIDISVFNAARILKLYGTMACKGDNIPERPHRMAQLLEIPSLIATVSRELLQSFAAKLPEIPKPEESPGTQNISFNLEAWMAKHGLLIRRQKSWQGGIIYELKECPFDPEHNNGEARIVQFPTGALSFGCFHNSCQGYDWHNLRERLDPDWNKRKEGVPKNNPHTSRHKNSNKNGQKENDTLWGGNFRDTLQNVLSSLSETRQKVSFQDVVKEAEKFLYITPDTKYALRLALANVTGNYLEEDPIWLLIVAAPASAKTEITQSLGSSPFAWNISSFTSKTLASGERNNPQASLLKRIGAFGFIFLKDLTTILELNPNERAEIFSQLREIYDGAYFKTFGNGVVINWKGKIGIVGACTPIIEKYGEAFKVLGERFLMCRISDVELDNQELALDKALTDQCSPINDLRNSLKLLVTQFLQGCLETAFHSAITITQDNLKVVKTCAKFIAQTRAAVVRDSYSRDDILVKPFQESPMRIGKQLKTLLKGLCIVDGVTTPSAAHFSYLLKLALDNIPSLRKEILEAVPKEGIFRIDLTRSLGYGEGSRHFRRLMEDLTKLEILREVKDSNRVSIFPSDTVSSFYALFDRYPLEIIEENDNCPENIPPTYREAVNNGGESKIDPWD